jgi:CheY-like chemotaxis protein
VRILIVDDLVDAADGVALLLRKLGHDARASYDGPTALRMAEEFSPDVILLDLALPKLDGYQVAARLRQLPTMQSVCLIALSGYGQEADVERAKQVGFDQHLLKPVELKRLITMLAQIAARPAGCQGDRIGDAGAWRLIVPA